MLKALLEIIERELVELGDAVQQLDPAIRRARVVRLDLVNRDELLVLARIAIDRLEDLRDELLMRFGLDQALERTDGLLVLRVAVEDLAVSLDGRFDGVHPRLAELGQTEHQGDLLLRIVGERELPVDVVREVGPHLLPREEAVERGERTLARRIDLEDLLVDGDRRLGLVEHLVVDESDLREEQLLLLRRLGELAAPAQHLEEVTPALGAPIELLE